MLVIASPEKQKEQWLIYSYRRPTKTSIKSLKPKFLACPAKLQGKALFLKFPTKEFHNCGATTENYLYITSPLTWVRGSTWRVIGAYCRFKQRFLNSFTACLRIGHLLVVQHLISLMVELKREHPASQRYPLFSAGLMRSLSQTMLLSVFLDSAFWKAAF